MGGGGSRAISLGRTGGRGRSRWWPAGRFWIDGLGSSLGLELGPPRLWWWRRRVERGRRWRWWWWTFLGVKEWQVDGTQMVAFGYFN